MPFSTVRATEGGGEAIQRYRDNKGSSQTGESFVIPHEVEPLRETNVEMQARARSAVVAGIVVLWCNNKASGPDYSRHHG